MTVNMKAMQLTCKCGAQVKVQGPYISDFAEMTEKWQERHEHCLDNHSDVLTELPELDMEICK